MMAEKKINEALAELRDEISQLEIGDQDVKDRLTSLIENIERGVDSGDSEDHSALNEEMQDVITFFEVEHPRITGIVNDIMMALNNMGI